MLSEDVVVPKVTKAIFEVKSLHAWKGFESESKLANSLICYTFEAIESESRKMRI